MAQSFIFSIAESLITKLASHAFQEASRVVGLYDHLRDLKKTLSLVKAVLLDADQKQEHNHELQEWLRQLKSVFYDAQDVLDEFECQTLRKQVLKAHGTIKDEVSHFFSSSNPLVFRSKMAQQIKDVSKRLDKVAADRHKFGLRIIDVDTRVVHRRDTSLMTHSRVSDSDVIGREHDKEKIIELLMQQNPNDDDKSLSVIAIVGIGGLGKTTLAKFNDKRIDECFSLKMWMSVSHKLQSLSISTPSYLRQCSLLFSLYPKDYEFLSLEVIRLWGALGVLASPRKNETSEDVSNSIWMNYYQDLSFKIHDLVHDLAVFVAKQECLLVNSHMQNIPENIRHLSFAEYKTIMFPNGPEGGSVESLLNTCVSKFKLLRVLNLCDSTCKTLPCSIGKLKHLRYFNIENNCNIKRLPNFVCKLQNLQLLNVSGCEKMKALPKGLRKLISLRHLGITTKQPVLPYSEITNLISLADLYNVSSHNMESIFGGVKLPALKTLYVADCHSLKSLPLDVKNFPELETLAVIGFTIAGGLTSTGISDCDNLEVLPEWLSTMTNLKSLLILDCPKLISLPDNIHHLTALERLRIVGYPELCRKCQPHVGEFWSKISHIKDVFIKELEKLEEEKDE
uniref:Rx N-terminal domain-containing protein n=1 Tax=Glycine max TaxID=3847 RepID=A0A0R0KES2_SOYBN